MRKMYKYNCSTVGCEYGSDKKSNFERHEATCEEKQTYFCECGLQLSLQERILKF